MDIDFIIFAGFVLYIFFQIFTPSKKQKQQMKAARQQQQRNKRPNPQGAQNPAPSQRNKSLEQILQEMYEQSTQQNPPDNRIELPQAPESIFQDAPVPSSSQTEVFSYDKEYKSYDEDFEGEKYDKRKKKEIDKILSTRQKGEHVSQTLHAYDVDTRGKKKKPKKKQGFKFNAKDAIIYDIIMNRKYK